MTERKSSWEGDDDTGADKYAPQNLYIAQAFSQAELNDLIRDLDLPKISAELNSRLKSKNSLAPGMSFSWYRNSEEEFTCYFQRLIPLYFAQIFLH